MASCLHRATPYERLSTSTSGSSFNANAPISARKTVSLQSSPIRLPLACRARSKLRCPRGCNEMESQDTISRGPSADDITRRAIVSAGLLMLASCTSPSGVGLLPVAAAKEFSIQDAIDAAEPGDVIQIPGGTYYEKLCIRKAVVLEPESKADTVTIVWDTTDHYEPVLACENANGAVVRGLVLRHSSPSIANNYAVFLQGGGVVLEDCDIMSSTGSGIAAEGGEHTVLRCSVHGCQRHGIAVFGTLEGEECMVLIKETTSEGNRQNGILVRDQGTAEIDQCVVRGNEEYGLSVTFGNCFVSKSTSIQSNRKGNTFQGAGSDVVLDT